MTQELFEELKAALVPRVTGFLETDLPRHDTDLSKEQLAGRIERLASRVARRQWQALTSMQQRRLVEELLDELLGFGPLGGPLRDRSVSEIMVNGFSDVFIERAGRLERLKLGFRDHEHLLSVIEKLLTSAGRQVTQAEPYVDGRLPDGSRVNVAIAPVAFGGPYLTIRKFSHQLWTVEDLMKAGSISEPAGRFLEYCVQGRLNLVVSGASSSGKTTLLNVLLSHIGPAERIIIIEDTVELQVRHPNVVRLSTRSPSLEGRGELTIRHLLKNAFHMRPDRIIVGEVRGEEALDVLQAMNTGHEGSMTTLHANSSSDVIERVVTMALMSNVELSDQGIRRQVQSAIDLIVHLERSADGGRHVVSIYEIAKGTEAGPTRLAEIFTRAADPRTGGGAGRLRASGIVPQCLQKLAQKGISVPNEFFQPIA
jgi:pilus assembly protein CpaF